MIDQANAACLDARDGYSVPVNSTAETSSVRPKVEEMERHAYEAWGAAVKAHNAIKQTSVWSDDTWRQLKEAEDVIVVAIDLMQALRPGVRLMEAAE